MWLVLAKWVTMSKFKTIVIFIFINTFKMIYELLESDKITELHLFEVDAISNESQFWQKSSKKKFWRFQSKIT